MKGRRVKKKKMTQIGGGEGGGGGGSSVWGEAAGVEGFWGLLGPEGALACGVAGALLFRLPHTHLGGSLRGNLQGQIGGSACWGEGLWLPGGRDWGWWGPPVPLIQGAEERCWQGLSVVSD